jgi:MIP family channel proteins
MRPLSSRLVAEGVGTFGLIYIGCGAVVVSGLAGAGFGLLGVALAHAVVLSVMVTAAMPVSGGHINPAVTLGLLSVRRISPLDAAAYLFAQLAGGVLGAFTLRHTLPPGIASIGTLGTPALSNAMTLGSGIALEAVLTFFLMSAVMGTAVAPDAPKVGGFGIGLVLLFDILVGGTFTGAAMNPARAFGPALVSGVWYAQPVWWIGPIIGAVIAAQLWDRVILRT